MGDVWWRRTSGRQIHPFIHSFNKHLHGSHIKPPVNVYQSNHSLGKIWRRINTLSSTDVSPPSSTHPGVRGKTRHLSQSVSRVPHSWVKVKPTILSEVQPVATVLFYCWICPLKCIYLMNTYIAPTICQESSQVSLNLQSGNIVIMPFYRWQNWSSGKLNNLPSNLGILVRFSSGWGLLFPWLLLIY